MPRKDPTHYPFGIPGSLTEAPRRKPVPSRRPARPESEAVGRARRKAARQFRARRRERRFGVGVRGAAGVAFAVIAIGIFTGLLPDRNGDYWHGFEKQPSAASSDR